MDPGVVRQKLTDRYNQDFVNEWNTVLKTSSVAGYGEQRRCRQEAGKTYRADVAFVGVAVLHFAQHGRGPGGRENAFCAGAGGRAAGPGRTRPRITTLFPSNKEYVEALGKLQSDIHALAQSPGSPDPAQLTQAGASADAASNAVTKMIASVPVDQQFGNQDQVRRLLEEPIKSCGSVAEARANRYCERGGQGLLLAVRWSDRRNIRSIQIHCKTCRWISSMRFSGRRRRAGKN